MRFSSTAATTTESGKPLSYLIKDSFPPYTYRAAAETIHGMLNDVTVTHAGFRGANDVHASRTQGLRPNRSCLGNDACLAYSIRVGCLVLIPDKERGMRVLGVLAAIVAGGAAFAAETAYGSARRPTGTGVLTLQA